MVHGIQFLKCNKGHILPISYDDNKCGCHHKGKPCIIINCHECLKEYLKDKENKKLGEMIQIPLDEDGLEEVKKLK